MSLDAYHTIRTQWIKVKSGAEISDVAFIVLRIVIFAGGIGWLIFSNLSPDTFKHISGIFLYFAIYSLLIYFWLFISPGNKKIIYGVSLLFDLLYASLLVRVTGGFESSFINGFYLITALYSFYFGFVPGVAIAAASSLLYFSSCGSDYCLMHWTDFFVRVAFLFMLAVPLGMISQKLKGDKEKIENLNRDLQSSIEELRNVQGKLIQVEKLSALGRLTADVAHEIRNPLTSIGGFARRLNNKLTRGSREKEYAEIVVAEVDRLERILRDVLAFSREPKSDMEYQNINGIIEGSVRTIEELCRDQSIELDVMLQRELPQVLLDRDQVRQAVSNLVSNAVDVMTDGGKLTIKTSLQRLYEVDFVSIEVSDSGPGLSDEAVNMIFEPFYTTKEIGAGTGLGLSICKKIIDEHNGLIFVESDAGNGTSFKMFFPYQSRENGAKVSCWEFHKCGVENTEGAAGMRCPAYPNYGRVCWAIAGTFCGQKVSGAIAQKLGDCKKCEFYGRVAMRKDL
jgi:signal transduction histidine kinase